MVQGGFSKLGGVSNPYLEKAQQQIKLGVSPVTTGVLVVFHLMSLLAVFTFSWRNLIVALVLHWLAVGLGISMGYHRLHTHRGFKTYKWFDYFLAVCGTLTLEGGPIFWVATHRLHHQYSDKPEDPHTPRVSGFWAHAGWIIFGFYLVAQAAVVVARPSMLSGFEAAVFSDGTLVFDASPAARDVWLLYRTALGRTPDTAGFLAWVGAAEAGLDRAALAAAFAGSAEFAPLLRASPAVFVSALYGRAFGRSPDAEGLGFWIGALRDGLSGVDLMADFALAPEALRVALSDPWTGYWTI